MTELDEYWQKFLSDTGRSPDERCSGDLFFEAKGFVGNELLSLVLAGKKQHFLQVMQPSLLMENLFPFLVSCTLL